MVAVLASGPTRCKRLTRDGFLPSSHPRVRSRTAAEQACDCLLLCLLVRPADAAELTMAGE
jgi:hypothetical protein